jgi:hypothetical protein
MIRHLTYSAEKAIDLIRQRRSPDALFNPDFVEFLMLEERLVSLEKCGSVVNQVS